MIEKPTFGGHNRVMNQPWWSILHDPETNEYRQSDDPNPGPEEAILYYDGWVWVVILQAPDLETAIEQAKVKEEAYLDGL